MTIMNMTGGAGDDEYALLKVDTQPPADFNKMNIISNTSVSSGLQIDKDRFITGSYMYIYENGKWTQKPFDTSITYTKYVAKTSDGYIVSNNKGYVWLVENDSTVHVIQITGSVIIPQCGKGGRYFRFNPTDKSVYEIIYDSTAHVITEQKLFEVEIGRYESSSYASLVYYDDDETLLFCCTDTDVQSGIVRKYDLSGEVISNFSKWLDSGYKMSCNFASCALGDMRISLIVVHRLDSSDQYTAYVRVLMILDSRIKTIYATSVEDVNVVYTNNVDVIYSWIDEAYMQIGISWEYRLRTSGVVYSKLSVYTKLAYTPKAMILVSYTSNSDYAAKSYGAMELSAADSITGMIIDGSGSITLYD